MGFFRDLLGAGEVVREGIQLIDDMHTSDVERIQADSEATVALIKAKTEQKAELVKAYAPFKKAQRWLMLFFVTNFFASFWIAVIMWGQGKDYKGFLEIFTGFQIGWCMLTIVAFYFGGGFVEGAIGATRKNKTAV